MELIVFISVFLLLGNNAYCNDPMENDNLFEGDMILSVGQYVDLQKGNIQSSIPLAAIKTNHWPKVIPYSISTELKKQSKFMSGFNEAISDYEKLTCLSFKLRTNQAGYMYFARKDGVCSSPVGYYSSRRQISLGDGCWTKGIIMHEIAHSLGFYHEQSRPDRDSFVTIKFENIKPGKEHNFQKHVYTKIDSMGSPYDYESLMHYRSTSFSSNGKKTIETKDPADSQKIGQRIGLSKLDVEQLNKLYKCDVVSPPPARSFYKHVCEGSYFYKRCPGGSKLKILYARYGYKSSTYKTELASCNSGKLYSSCKSWSSSSQSEVKKKCDGKSKCFVKAADSVFGKPRPYRSAPNCTGKNSMLTVKYSCV